MLKMCEGRSFVVREQTKSTKSSLIEVIEFNPDQSQFAKVVYTDHPDLIPGCKILIGKYTGAPVTHENTEGYIVEKDDVLAIIE